MATEDQSALSSRDIYRYRYHHGTNLGSVFVLEKWLTGSMFPEGSNSSELDAVSTNVQQSGIDDTRNKFEQHWREYCSDGDLDWLVEEANCTSIRLPVGYWTLGASFCEGTPFQEYAAVYENAWPAVIDFISRAGARGIGVLVDLHGLPGGANPNDHSGTTSCQAELWSNPSYQDLSIRALEFLATNLKDTENLIGIQLLNEAESSSPDHGLWPFYDRAITAIPAIDATIPLYLSDAWNLSSSLAQLMSRNTPSSSTTNPLVLDTHLYWTFSDADRSRPAQDLIASASQCLSELSNTPHEVHSSGAPAVIVGEYSAVLSEETWSLTACDSDDARADLVRQFAQAETQRYTELSAGSFFWTYRMDWMDGGEWGFKEQTCKGNIAAPPNLGWSAQDVAAKADEARSRTDELRSRALDSHVGYWDGQYPGEYEHWRFEAGWAQGWADALGMFVARTQSLGQTKGADRVGSVDLLVLKRLREAGDMGKFVWEYEHGFRQGIKEFNQVVGI